MINDRLDPLAEARQSFHLGQLSNAIRLAQEAAGSPNLTPQAQILQARCLIEQGHFPQADILLSTALANLPQDSEMALEMRLRLASLRIYLTGHIAQIWEEARDVLAGNPLQRLRGLALDLWGRGLAIAVIYHLASPEDLVEAKRLLSEAIDSYRLVGENDTALAALLKLGQLHLLSTPDLAAARLTFQEAWDLAQSAENLVRQAEAKLRLAELDFDASLAKRAENPEAQIDPAPYQQAMLLYENAGHVLGPADVLLSVGTRLTKAGYDGSDSLQQALLLYEKADNLIGLSSTVAELSTWYLQQGELSLSLEYRQRAIAIAREMGFPLSQATACLGIGDYYFRTGDYARALAAYEQVEELTVAPSVLAMQGLNLANSYSMMNLHDRAAEVCRAAIEILEQSGSSQILSLAYFILGNVISGKGNWAEAIPVWRKSLDMDEASNNLLEQAKKLQCIAQATVMQYHRAGGYSIPETAYEEAMALYSQTIELLKRVGNNEAVASIANTYELQGQTLLVCARPLDCIKYLELAVKEA